MLALCRRYMKDDYEAENCLMQGFARVFESVSEFRMMGSLEGWVRKIMVRVCLMELRKKASFPIEVTLPSVEEPLFQLPENLDYSFLLNLIRGLPEGYRAVFNLYVIEGFSHSEIAGMLEISEGSSRSQLAGARNLLKKKLLKSGISQSSHFAI